MSQRRRMYLFERAYVDYARRFGRVWSRLWATCGSIWAWCWSGPGVVIFERLLQLAVVAGAVLASAWYVRYEMRAGHGFTATTGLVMAVIFVFAGLVLWGWKQPVHVLARAVSGATAAGAIALVGLVGMALALALFAVYLLILFTLTALSFLLFLPMRAGQELWLAYRKIAYHCPSLGCPNKRLPEHQCPVCGTWYPDLLPSFYGIFHHICMHESGGTRLPTMNFLGRNKLRRRCGGCERELVISELGEVSVKPVLVIGGTKAGKTVYLRQVMRGLMGLLASLPGGRAQVTETQQREVEADLEQLDRGQVMAATLTDEVQAYGLLARVPKVIEALLYLYDVPGEQFASIERLGRMQAIQNVAGIMLLVDPLSIPQLAQHLQGTTGSRSDEATAFHEIVSVLIAGIQPLLKLRPNEQCAVPLAVVIGKSDMLPADDFPFLADLRPERANLADPNCRAKCREALVKLGESNAVRALEQQFAQVEYFACSALGRDYDPRDTTAFAPTGTIEPFLWLLQLDVDPVVRPHLTPAAATLAAS